MCYAKLTHFFYGFVDNRLGTGCCWAKRNNNDNITFSDINNFSSSYGTSFKMTLGCKNMTQGSINNSNSSLQEMHKNGLYL